MSLLTRDQFRAAVFTRDGHQCVFCPETTGLDAHHVLERRLWPDGGYYLDNGATVCQTHHLLCERTTISVEEVRAAAGLKVVLPPHLYEGTRYDKWGNVLLENGARLPGELFDDASVQKVLADVLPLFRRYVKYPRTFHLPWSPGVTSDDRVQHDLSALHGQEVVVTVKMDGENTSLYSDHIHARSLEYVSRVDRARMKALHSLIASDIPDTMRICGENLWARHSVVYEDLSDFFMVFSIWEGTTCFSWDDTLEWTALLALTPVPVLYRGPWDERVLRQIKMDEKSQEGYVVRPAGAFQLKDFSRSVLKWVRPNHVRTQAHWTRKILPNGVRGG